MGILDKKSNTFDYTVSVPPAPPIASRQDTAANRQPTDAEVVATLARTLVNRLNELTDELDKRLSAVSVPAYPDEARKSSPKQSVTAPYFAGVCGDLETVATHLDRIESLLARLAI